MISTLSSARLLVAVLSTLLAVSCSRTPADPAHEFQQGVTTFQQQQYDRAARHFERALAVVPDQPQALNFLAVCQLQLGHPDTARDLLVRAVEREPTYAAARYNLGLAWLELGQPDRAIAELRQATRQGAAPPDPERQLGLAYIRASAWLQAEESLTRAAPTANNLNLLGIVNARLHRYPPAADCFRRALATDPKLGAAQLNLAIVLHRHLDQGQEAASHYQQYLELTDKPERPDQIRDALAEIKRNAGAPVRSTAPSPTPAVAPTPIPTLTMAPAATATNLAHVATPAAPGRTAPLTTAPAVAPASPTSKTRVTAAAKPLRPGNRSRATAMFNKGVQAQQHGLLDEAQVSYQGAVQTDPTFAAAYYNLAVLQATHLHQPERALDYYELALQANPEYTDARFNYAILLQSQGYNADAVQQYERILLANPSDAAVHLSVASLYARSKETFPKAREHFQAYLGLAPNSPLSRDIRRWLDQNP